jgi:hypothetical protein
MQIFNFEICVKYAHAYDTWPYFLMCFGTYIFNYYALVLNVKNIIKNVHKEMVVIFNFKVIGFL